MAMDRKIKSAAVQELLAEMTLEEKASLCSGRDFWHLNPYFPDELSYW
jgi:hypothetical protein